MRAAITDAGIEPSAIGYVNAHGGASRPGDPSEIAALRHVLGDAHAARTAVSATKSMHGHCMGATGAIEAALTALAVADGTHPADDQPPRARSGVQPASTTSIDVARDARLTAAMSTNNGLGGHNAAIVLVPWEGR